MQGENVFSAASSHEMINGDCFPLGENFLGSSITSPIFAASLRSSTGVSTGTASPSSTNSARDEAFATIVGTPTPIASATVLPQFSYSQARTTAVLDAYSGKRSLCGSLSYHSTPSFNPRVCDNFSRDRKSVV